MTNLRRAAATAVLAVLVGCGGGEDVRTADATTTTRPADTVYEVTATVLSSDAHGPELCLGGIAESYPPQCSGPPIVGWDWDAVDDEESASGASWGEWHVTGRYDGRRFTPTAPPGPPRRDPDPVRPDFSPACERPTGGWVHDPSKLSEDDLRAAMDRASSSPDFGGMWVSYDPAPPPTADGGPDGATDTQPDVVNAAFTRELDARRRELRSLWGGGLCVTQARHTHAALQRIVQRLHDDGRAEGHEVLAAYADEVANVVRADLVVGGTDAQRWADDRYGDGTVVVTGRLRPVR